MTVRYLSRIGHALTNWIGAGRARGHGRQTNEPVLMYRAVKVKEGLGFTAALYANKHVDASQQVLAAGDFPHSPATDLMLACVRRGQRLLDLGANVGAFALAAAAAGCRVVAVEASPSNAYLLQASAQRNRFKEFRVIQSAISNHQGTLRFFQAGPFGHVIDQSPVAARTPRTVDDQVVEVTATTVDRLLRKLRWPCPDFIKMDIEGSEIAAVQGMSQLLSRPDAPAILYEGNGHTLAFYNRTCQELKAALERFGYHNYLVDGPGCLRPVGAEDLQADTCVDYLAVKQLPSSLPGWKLLDPLSPQEIVVRVVASSEFPTEHHRAYIARALRTAPAWLVGNDQVVQALRKLRVDAHEDVRQAAAWSATLEQANSHDRARQCA